MLKQTTVFDVSFNLRAIFKMSVGNSMILPAALPRRSLSNVQWLVGGICCRMRTSFLRVDGCCCISVHVPTFFCCCELQPVVLGDEKCQCVFL